MKKLIALTAGLTMILMGVLPVLAQSQDATTEVDIESNIALEIVGNQPFGTGGATTITPTSVTDAAQVRAGAGAGVNTMSTFTMKTNSSAGGTIEVNGVDGILNQGASSIANTGAVLADGACEAIEDVAANTETGLYLRAATTDSHADFQYATDGDLATQYGADTDVTTRLWCHAPAVASPTELANTDGFNNPATGTALKVDYLVSVLPSGTVPTGTYTETLTFTASANN